MKAIRIRRPIVAAATTLSLLLSVAACTSDPTPVPEPEDVETCDELVEVSVQLVGVWIDVLGELPVEQLTAEQPPPEFEELAAIGEDLDARAARLGCDAEEMNVAVRAELAQNNAAQADDVVIGLLLDIIQGGVVGELPPTPTTSTTAEPSS